MKAMVVAGVAALTLLDIASSQAQAQNWTGAYAGIHAGYRWSESSFAGPSFVLVDPFGPDPTVPARSETYSANSGLIGAHAGYNLQMPGNWLIGVEGDIAYAKGKDSTTSRILGADGVVNRTSTVEMGWQGTLRARLGFVTGQALIYATGGLAFADIKWSDSIVRQVGAFQALSYSASKSEVRTGWVVGGGVEWAFAPQWTVRTEYLYEDFGSFSVPMAGTTKLGTLDTDAHKVRVGVSFRF